MRPRLMAWMVAGALAGMAAPLAVQAQPAVAPAERIAFDLPAQPLLNALRAFGRQTQYQVLYDGALIAGRQAPALNGRFTPREAIERLIAGSGLSAHSAEQGSFTLRKVVAPELREGSAATPSTVTVPRPASERRAATRAPTAAPAASWARR